MHQFETLYQSMVVMTPKVKVYRSKVKFLTWRWRFVWGTVAHWLEHWTHGLMGVVWHTGKVLACGAVGPRFKPRQGQGIL